MLTLEHKCYVFVFLFVQWDDNVFSTYSVGQL